MLTSEKPLCFFVQLGGYQTQPGRVRLGLDVRQATPETAKEGLFVTYGG